MNKKIIWTDDDVDGLMSARLTYNYLVKKGNTDIEMMYQPWDAFGITEENAKTIVSKSPTEVFILDVGSDKRTLTSIRPILEKGIPVTLLDNHPPNLDVIGAEEYNEYTTLLDSLKVAFPLTYRSTTDNCTTGIVYQMFEATLESNPLNKLWAILGLRGDIATNTSEGKPIYNRCISSHKNLIRGFYYGSFTQENIDFMTGLFNWSRRLLYDESPPVLFGAIQEIESNPKIFGVGWLEIYKLVDGLTVGKKEAFDQLEVWKTLYPNVSKLARTYVDSRAWSQVYKERGNCIILDYGRYGVSLISHPWNIGSALCNVKTGAKEMGKAHFCINDIPGKHVHIAGRSYKDDVHIGKVFHNCNQDILSGGGLLQAGGANSTAKVEDILEELTNVASALYPK